jgi:hypothetical protein
MYSAGNLYSADLIVKLKKLFNIVRKHYELEMYKVFLTIERYGRYLQDVESTN